MLAKEPQQFSVAFAPSPAKVFCQPPYFEFSSNNTTVTETKTKIATTGSSKTMSLAPGIRFTLTFIFHVFCVVIDSEASCLFQKEIRKKEGLGVLVGSSYACCNVSTLEIMWSMITHKSDWVVEWSLSSSITSSFMSLSFSMETFEPLSI